MIQFTDFLACLFTAIRTWIKMITIMLYTTQFLQRSIIPNESYVYRLMTRDQSLRNEHGTMFSTAPFIRAILWHVLSTVTHSSSVIFSSWVCQHLCYSYCEGETFSSVFQLVSVNISAIVNDTHPFGDSSHRSQPKMMSHSAIQMETSWEQQHYQCFTYTLTHMIRENICSL